MYIDRYYPINKLDLLRDAVTKLNVYFDAIDGNTPFVMVGPDEFSDNEANLIMIYDDSDAPLDAAGDSTELETAQQFFENIQMFILGYLIAKEEMYDGCNNERSP